MGYKQTKEGFLSIDLKEMRPEGFLKTILDRQENNVRTVNAKHGWESREECPICGSYARKYQFTKFEIGLYTCMECGTGYFNKIPKVPDDIYSSNHALIDAQKGYLENKSYRMKRFAEERIDLILGTIDRSGSDISLLDVGCGTGWFLEVAMEKGISVYGLELGKDLARFTAERLGITVWNMDLTNLNTELKFDVITMFDLIEHVTDPVGLIESAKQFLKPNGIIVIFTPNFDSLAIQHMKEYSNLVMPAEHLCYLTEQSMTRIAKLTGMELSYFKTKGIDLGDLMSFFEFKGEFELSKNCGNLYDLVQPVIDQSNSGNHLRCILKNMA